MTHTQVNSKKGLKRKTKVGRRFFHCVSISFDMWALYSNQCEIVVNCKKGTNELKRN